MKFIDSQPIYIIQQELFKNIDGGDAIVIFNNFGIYGGNTISNYEGFENIDGGSASE